MTIRPAPPELLPWALSVLGATVSSGAPGLTPIAGDASARRYFRLACAGRSYVAVDSPPASQKNAEFVQVQQLLAAAGIRVPALLGADLARGFLLLEDLGERVLLPALDAVSAHAHYQRAFDILEKMAMVSCEGAGLGVYDRPLLREELSRFPEWFVRGLLQHDLAAAEEVLIDALSARLIDSALQQPRVLVHRDFHSRNLMLVHADELAVIDFQDAVTGPVTYDLVSLLRDCYIQWPERDVRTWAAAYRERLRARGLLDACQQAQFMCWFDWMGLQRHLKVLGTFARLYLRDGKSGYLADLPLVIRYVTRTLDQYAPDEPVFAEFAAWFRQRLGPLIVEQSWNHAA